MSSESKCKRRRHVKAKTHFLLIVSMLPERQRDPATKALTKECAKCPACKDRLMNCHEDRDRSRRGECEGERKEEEKGWEIFMLQMPAQAQVVYGEGSEQQQLVAMGMLFILQLMHWAPRC